MAADCLDHVCSEREYRASIITAKVFIKDEFKPKCQNITEGAMISVITDQLKKKLDDAKEDVKCPDKCKCKMGDWPKDKNQQEIWEKLEGGVTYFQHYVEPTVGCVAEVTISYDYECRDRMGKCYKPPPS
jgi:hypothetical protein